MGKLNELNAEAKKLGYKYYWKKGADKKRRVSFSNSENSFEGFFNEDGYSLNWTKASASSGPSKESVDLAEKFYKAYSELQRKIEPGRNGWKKDEALLKELKEADDGKRPSSSIWGRPDHCKKLAPGVYTVDTPGHGGIMVSSSVASKVLSPETLAHCSGLLENGYYQFEEDCDAAIPLVEMYRKGISEGYSWNEGRQAKFYELAQEEVLKWNAPLFESWVESMKTGPFVGNGVWNTIMKVLPKSQVAEFKDNLFDEAEAAKWKKVARAVVSADKVGTQKGDKPSPLVLHYVHKDGTEYFVSEINDNGLAWGFRLPANLRKENAMAAEWINLGIEGMKADPNIRLDPNVPEGMTVEAALYNKRPDFFPQFKEFAITSEGKYGNLLRESGVSGEKVLAGGEKSMDNEIYSCFYNRFENEYIAVRETNGDWEYARLDDRFNVIYHDAGFSSKEEKTLEDAVKSVIELYYRPDDPIYVDYDTTPADYAALGERAKRLDIENWTRAGLDVEKAVNKSLGVNDFLREGGNVYEPKPVALEDIVAQMDFRLEVTESGKLKLWDLQRNEYLNNERLDGSPFGSEPEEYVSSSWEFSSAEEIFDRLDSFIRDYFYDDMASELERAGVSTENASTLDDLCELWKAELNKGGKELSKGELNMALGIVNPDTVVMPKGFARSGKEASADEVEKVTCENFQQKLAERAERDVIKTAQALLSEMDEAERKKFNGIVRSQGLKKPEDVDAFFAALAKGTKTFELKDRKPTPPEQGFGM